MQEAKPKTPFGGPGKPELLIRWFLLRSQQQENNGERGREPGVVYATPGRTTISMLIQSTSRERYRAALLEPDAMWRSTLGKSYYSTTTTRH
jgi:hypothetical protein